MGARWGRSATSGGRGSPTGRSGGGVRAGRGARARCCRGVSGPGAAQTGSPDVTKRDDGGCEAGGGEASSHLHVKRGLGRGSGPGGQLQLHCGSMQLEARAAAVCVAPHALASCSGVGRLATRPARLRFRYGLHNDMAGDAGTCGYACWGRSAGVDDRPASAGACTGTGGDSPPPRQRRRAARVSRVVTMLARRPAGSQAGAGARTADPKRRRARLDCAAS